MFHVEHPTPVNILLTALRPAVPTTPHGSRTGPDGPTGPFHRAVSPSRSTEPLPMVTTK